MGNEIVQIDYQEANQLAQRFSKQQAQVQAILQSLRQTIQSLENGGWMGDAATACFKEFHSEVVPAYTRLCNVLGEGQSTLQGIATLFRQAEEEAATLFRGEFAAAAGGESGIAQAVGGSGGNIQADSSGIYQTVQAFATNLSGSGGGQGQPSELETLIRSLKDQCVDPNVILDAIAKATPAERQAILNDPQLMEYIRISEGTAADVLTAALLEGSLHWPSPSGPSLDNGLINRTSDFALWMRGEAGPPNPSTGTMNCWEATMYAAYLSGEISESQLREIHQNAATIFNKALASFSDKYGITLTEANIPHLYDLLTQKQKADLELAYSAYYQPIQSALGADNRTEWQAGDQPVAGSIVFFESSDSPLSHVAIATGRITPDGKTEVMSLWTLPRNSSGQPVSSMQRTTIEDLEAAMIDANMAPSRISTAPNPGDRPND
ncbi:MAG: WXG100 family type VII secretion target [Chloroflexi bacterium]|nr:WXG100 family type VII secretion target [Chloroflexota bacterium]